MSPKHLTLEGKNTTLTNQQKRALCEHYQQHPSLTQRELMKWVHTTYRLSISQGTVSNILRQSNTFIYGAGYTNPNQRRKRAVKYPTMEERLGQWAVTNQGKVPITGDMLENQGRKFLVGVDHNLKFSNGWKGGFNRRWNLRCFRRHGEDGSVNEEVVQEALPRLREVLDRYDWENIYNMDETGLYYRMEVGIGAFVLFDQCEELQKLF